MLLFQACSICNTNFLHLWRVTFWSFLVVLRFSVAQKEKEKYANFAEQEHPKNLYSIYQSGTYDVHATLRYGRVIELLAGEDIRIRFKCLSDGMRGSQGISVAWFCFKFNAEERCGNEMSEKCKCEQVNNNRNIVFGPSGRQISIQMIFESKGAVATLSKITSTFRIKNMNMICGLKNKQGMIWSSSIRLFDYREDIKQVSKQKSNENITWEVNKMVIGCLQKQLMVSTLTAIQFQWHVCDDDGHRSCTDIKKIGGSSWPFTILPGGALCSFFVPEGLRSRIENKYLKCTIGQLTITTFSQAISFGEPGLWTRLQKYLDSDFKISVVNHEAGSFFLPVCLAFADTNVSFSWRIGSSLVSKLDEEEERAGRCYITDFSLIPVCQGPFLEGDFTVVMSARQGLSSLMATISIEVQKEKTLFGEISNDDPMKFYGIDSDSLEIRCNHTKGKTPLLSIRGMLIDLQDIQKSVTAINNEFKDIMAPLKLTIKQEAGVLIAKFSDLKYDNRTRIHSDMYLYCSEEGAPSQQIIYLQMLPNPKPTNIFFQTFGDTDMTFLLEVSNKDQFSSFGINVTCAWKLSNQEVSDIKMISDDFCMMKVSDNVLQYHDTITGIAMIKELRGGDIETIAEKKYDSEHVIFIALSLRNADNYIYAPE